MTQNRVCHLLFGTCILLLSGWINATGNRDVQQSCGVAQLLRAVPLWVAG